MQIAVAPTVFVALGGTGQIILQRLRRRLQQRVGTADMPFFRYLYLDTDQGALRTAVTGLEGTAAGWSATNTIDPSPDTVARVQNPQLDNGVISKTLGIESWFNAYARNELGTVAYARGVGGRRMYSRLGFLASQNLGVLEQTLIAFYDDLVTCGGLAGQPLDGIEPPYLDVTPRHVDAGVRFIVVTSAGGGTGSGCMIDFGFLIRKLRAQHQWSQVYQFSHVTMARPGIDTENQVRNTAALLTELDNFDGTQTYDAHYLNLPATPTYEDRNPPYDMSYMVSATQQSIPLHGTPKQAFDLLLWRMAEYLLADAVAAYDDDVDAQEIRLPRSGPVGSIAFLGDIGLNPKGLETYGVSCREWPAAMMHVQLYTDVIARLAKTWCTAQEDRTKEVALALRTRLGLPDASAQANGEPRTVGSDGLKEALLQPINDIDPLRLLQGLEASAYDEKGRVLATELPKLQDAVQRHFRERSGPPTHSDDVGVTYGVVRTNLQALQDLANRQPPAAGRRGAAQPGSGQPGWPSERGPGRP